MNLIKLSTGFYPYTLAELQRDNPLVSFPSDLAGVDLAEYDAALVETDEPPKHDDKTEKLEPLAPEKVLGEWRVKWAVKPLTDKEIRERQPQDWDAFNAYMLTDATFKSYRDIVRAVDGELNSALFDAYSLVDTKGTGAFLVVWTQWCVVSQITALHKEDIANVAEGFNLPADFVSVLRG